MKSTKKKFIQELQNFTQVKKRPSEARALAKFLPHLAERDQENLSIELLPDGDEEKTACYLSSPKAERNYKKRRKRRIA